MNNNFVPTPNYYEKNKGSMRLNKLIGSPVRSRAGIEERFALLITFVFSIGALISRYHSKHSIENPFRTTPNHSLTGTRVTTLCCWYRCKFIHLSASKLSRIFYEIKANRDERRWRVTDAKNSSTSPVANSGQLLSYQMSKTTIFAWLDLKGFTTSK